MESTQQLPLFSDASDGTLSSQTALKNAIEAFQRHLRNEGKSGNTIKGFSSDIRLLYRYLGEEVSIGSIKTSDLNRFLRWLEHERKKPCSPKSYARRVTTLKVFFKWLHSAHIRPDDPALPLVQRSGPAPLQPVLSRNDIQKLRGYTTLLAHAEKSDPRPDMLVRLLLKTGMKKNECMALRLDSFDRSDPQVPLVHVRHKTPQNKYKARILPLDPEWLDILDAYVARYKIRDQIFTCTARNLEYILHDAAKKADIESRVSFEILRWTCAVHDYLDGVDMDELREKMGLSEVSWRETSSKIRRLAAIQLKHQKV